MKSDSLRSLTQTAVMTALLCVLGPLMIPVGPVPVTLQTMVVFLSVFTLGMRRGTLAVAAYLLLGCAGLPVFTGFAGGLGKVLGPTGGFLAGFVPMALITGFFAGRFPQSLAAQYAGAAAGLAVCYALGTAWLMCLTGLPLTKALHAAVYPFVALDAVKIGAALFCARALHARLELVLN